MRRRFPFKNVIVLGKHQTWCFWIKLFSLPEKDETAVFVLLSADHSHRFFFLLFSTAFVFSTFAPAGLTHTEDIFPSLYCGSCTDLCWFSNLFLYLYEIKGDCMKFWWMLCYGFSIWGRAVDAWSFGAQCTVMWKWRFFFSFLCSPVKKQVLQWFSSMWNHL